MHGSRKRKETGMTLKALTVWLRRPAARGRPPRANARPGRSVGEPRVWSLLLPPGYPPDHR